MATLGKLPQIKEMAIQLAPYFIPHNLRGPAR